MPSSAQSAATASNAGGGTVGERLHNDERTTTTSTTIPHEPPKLKTTLKTPPKQATNPLQFVKVGPCSLYRTAQEQLQKVQEIKKIKQEVRDDPEDWQSNLDNWKSSRRKRQEHIIERVVEVKKLELEEHDRQRRRSKTFSEMMEERGNRGRKLSISLAVYNEEDANDLSDLGIGTSSGKSSISGDTHDDAHSVLSDRDSEIEKNHLDIDGTVHENGNDANESNGIAAAAATAKTVVPSIASTTMTTITTASTVSNSKATFTSTVAATTVTSAATTICNLNNGSNGNQQEYDSATTATASSPEPEEYTYEGAIRGYVSRVSQNIPRRSLVDLDAKLLDGSNNGNSTTVPAAPIVKVDILKRREVFEKTSLENRNGLGNNSNNNTNNRVDCAGGKSIKERLSILERQKAESEALEKLNKSPRQSTDNTSVKERFKLNAENGGKELKTRDLLAEELESVKPLRERLFNLEKIAAGEQQQQQQQQQHSIGELSAKSIKERLISLDANRAKETNNKRPGNCFHDQTNNRVDNLTPSERSSSPDSEYRVPRATFHQSLDSLDADASSGPDTFERVQSLEELDYQQTSRRYPASTSSAEILNDTDREDSGIHTADASCSVSQADEPIEDENHASADKQQQQQHQPVIIEEKTEFRNTIETSTLLENTNNVESVEEKITRLTLNAEPSIAVLTETTSKKQQQTENQAVAVAAKPEEDNTVKSRQSSSARENKTTMSEENDDEEEITMTMENKNNARNDDDLMTKVEGEGKNNRDDESRKRTIDDATSIGVMESAQLVQETIVALQNKEQQQQHTPVRPSTLALEITTTFNGDPLSPVSPVTKQILPLSFSSDEEVITGISFPLGPPTSVEPPKEKPPPPPIELSDEENHPIEPLKRLNSTRRIKKELRTRRSDFFGMGIEGFNDDELERELTLSKPPDMAAILAEERRIEQLHRRSYDTDSNYEQDSSHERDSGVELGQAEDWTKQPISPDMSQHSRQSSEPFGASVTSSEEDEISKKEREIIEVLEREEQWRYENNRDELLGSDIGEKLAHKLRELEEEKMQLERERASQDNNAGTTAVANVSNAAAAAVNTAAINAADVEAQPQQQQSSAQQHRCHQETTPETLRMNEENLRKQDEIVRKQDEARQKELEKKEQQQQQQMKLEKEARIQAEARWQENQKKKKNIYHENKSISPALSCNEEEYASRQEVLRVERELLQLEQEELKRQRNNLAYREQKQQQQQIQMQEQWKSLQDVAQSPSQPQMRHQPYGKPLPAAPINYRASMPNLQLSESSLALRRRPPPPPIPPAKPLRLVEQRQQRIGLPIGNSRIPSADSIPQQVEAPLRPSCSATTLSSGHHGQQMSRQTLQALSAVPRPRIVQGDQWVQRRKSDIPRGAHDFNYQHWLIQEAEQRRISEKNMQRSSPRKPHVTGTSVPYAASPPRNESKPLPDSIIQTLTQRVQNRAHEKPLSPRRRLEHSASQEHLHSSQNYQIPQQKVHQSPNSSINSSSSNNNNNSETQEKMLSVSGKKKCSHCGDELGRGAAMIIESLRLFYHMECFKCCVCHVRLGDGLMGTDVRVRNHKLHCHNCYSSDDGVKFSCV